MKIQKHIKKIGGKFTWEIVAVKTIAKFFGSPSYFYCFSVDLITEVVDAVVINSILNK